MKKIGMVSLLLLIALSTFSQTRREERMKEKNHESSIELFDADADDKDFTQYQIPDSFKNAQAIILCQKIKYSCTENGRGAPYTSSMHRKLVIVDKSALEDFSTLYFDLELKKGSDKIAIKILKKDGKQNVVTGQDAIKEEKGEVPRIYRSYYSTSKNEYYKMAIPDLEVGDTLEYFLQKVYKAGYMTTIDLPLEYYFVNSKYPCIKQKIDFELSKAIYLTAKSVFGAAEIKPVDLDDRRLHAFSFVESNRNGIEDERWLHESRELPHVKFQLIHINDKKDNFMSDEPETIKKNVTREDMETKFKNILEKGGMTEVIFSDEFGRMRKNYKDVENKDTLVELIYNHIRAKFRHSHYPVSDEYFAGIFYTALRRKDIEAQLVAVPNKFLTSMDNLVLTRELIYCVKYKDHFIFPTQSCSNVYENDKFYDGQKGFAARMDDRGRKVESVMDITLPASTFNDNVEDDIYDVSIKADNFEQVKVVDTSSYKGMFKRDYYSYFSKLEEMNERDDTTILFKSELKEGSQRGNPTRLEEIKRKREEAIKANYEEFKKNHKEKLGDSYSNVISVDTFEHLQTGTKPHESVLRDHSEYTLGDLTKKIGNNYIIELGKIIGSQIEIKKDEHERRSNIWIEFPKQLNNKIRFKIPEGYHAEGLENFNFNVDNEAGKFTSNAVMENGYVVLSTQKIYKQSYLPKTQWKNLVEMLDAAYNLTQKQLILKK